MPELPSAVLEIDLLPSDRALGLIFDSATLGLFDTAELAGGRGWADVTADLLSASCERGSDSGGLTAIADAGTFSAELLNASSQYDPTNPDSPYWNTLGGHTELTPMRRVRVRVEAPGVNHPPAPYLIWSGFLDTVELVYEPGSPPTAQLHATDAIKVLGNIAVSLTLADGTHAAAAMVRVLDAANWTARTIYNALVTTGTAELSSDAWAAAKLIAETEMGDLYLDGFGNVTFRDRDAAATEGRSKYRAVVFAGSAEVAIGDGALPFRDGALVYTDEDIANDVTITRLGGLPQRSIDTASIARFLRRTSERTDLPFETDAEAATYAALALARQSTPALALTSLAFDLARDDRLVTQAFLREIGDRIEVHVPAPGRDSALSRTVFIRGVRHEWDASSWVTTFALADASYLGDGVQAAHRDVSLTAAAALAVAEHTARHSTVAVAPVAASLAIHTAHANRDIAIAATSSFVATAHKQVQTSTSQHATGAANSGSNPVSWTSLANAYDGNSSTSANVTGNASFPKSLNVTGFPSIPPGASVDGVQIDVVIAATGSARTRWIDALKSGANVAGTFRLGTISKRTITIGGPTNALGFTAADVNAANSGVQIYADSGSAYTVGVYEVTFTVWYTY